MVEEEEEAVAAEEKRGNRSRARGAVGAIERGWRGKGWCVAERRCVLFNFSFYS